MCIVLGAEVRRQFSVEEEDELLQFAIQQSLIEAGSEKDEVLKQAFWNVQMLHVSDASLECQWFSSFGVVTYWSRNNLNLEKNHLLIWLLMPFQIQYCYP